MLLEELGKDLKGKSILITGGTGFFGKNLCAALVALNASKNLGMKIYALGRTQVFIEGVRVVLQDITTPFTFQEPVDLIIHAATPVTNAYTQLETTMNIIVNGTQQVLNFAEKINCKKFLLISSGAVYGEQPETLKNIPEDYEIKEPFYSFKSAYSTGKRISEIMALDWSRRTGANLTIARCFAFSGHHLPLDQHFALGNFVKDALGGNKVINILGDGTAVRSYMDTDDLVTWLMTILIHGESGEAYNVGSDQAIAMKDLALKIAQKFSGASINIQNENGKSSRYVPSIKKAQTLLNLDLKVNLDESIQKMIDFNRGKNE